MLKILRKAQSTAEYAILLSLVVAAAMGIQAEVKRAIQARIHQAAMALSENQEYEPTSGTKTTTRQSSNLTRTENYVTEGSDQPWITTQKNDEVEWNSTESK